MYDNNYVAIIYIHMRMCFTRPCALCKLQLDLIKSVLTLYMSQYGNGIVFDLCSHISVQGKWVILSCLLFGAFTGLEGNTGADLGLENGGFFFVRSNH